MKNELDNILSKVRTLFPYLTQKYEVNSIEIFGSYVRNEQDSGSDLDLLVSFNKIPSLIKFIEMKNYLTDQLQINVDLVMKDSLKPQLIKNILSEVISI
ncbi:MAG: DNA polymerase III subunit beta [Ignavibacteria bacterium CG2_30_36_16]|nr:nucleotidyltransferase family protein [Ignavibacteria bacterium]OIP54883.1 MAG: DNA polymerase III subunit beta [Ignavibacteria bacterium CG2_30_36_16]PJB00690.1 MAG: DNA polymerase III subunit beta [Ignavibacteria bacterium CG_4_9_14_3_um_filter_36_18]